MTIYYKVKDRKPLVQAVSEFVGEKAIYQKTPTCAYKIGSFTVDRSGNLVFDDMVDREKIHNLIEFLAEREFIAKEQEVVTPTYEPPKTTENNTA